jgi:hypothetical protein
VERVFLARRKRRGEKMSFFPSRKEKTEDEKKTSKKKTSLSLSYHKGRRSA